MGNGIGSDENRLSTLETEYRYVKQMLDTHLHWHEESEHMTKSFRNSMLVALFTFGLTNLGVVILAIIKLNLLTAR